MTIKSSCGHVVECVDDLVGVSVKSETRCGAHSISYMSVCRSCHKIYETESLLAHTVEEEDEWLASGQDCCGMC